MSEDETLPGSPTVNIPKADPVLIALTKLTQSVDRVGADVRLVSNDLSIVKDRLVIVETWKGEQDMRASRTSTGVRNLSLSDLEHAAQLAQERAAREALATKVDALTVDTQAQTKMLTTIQDAVTGVLKSPMVIKIAYAAGGAILATLTAWGAR